MRNANRRASYWKCDACGCDENQSYEPFCVYCGTHQDGETTSETPENQE
jgi:hypothetical protein